ncbi:MAG: GreA/GreB family elongation factor [Anaerolineales bacterium]|nr:GreA/GreB family elongation factor [Anaerolineales bacterium]
MSGIKINVSFRVEVELLSTSEQPERLVLTIVPDQNADFASGLLGVGTPLAKAILGQQVGSQVPYVMHDIYAVRILHAAPVDSLDAEAARQRQAEAEKARRQVEHTSAVSFASSFSGKWGDYDPGAVGDWNEDPERRDES